MSTEPERNRASRRLAETALVRLLHELGDTHSPSIIVLGGLVPDTLVADRRSPAPRHLGTTDVDLLVDLQVDVDTDVGELEAALQRLGFAPEDKAWRWSGDVDGIRVKLDFVCELDEQPADDVFRPAGCAQLGVSNLRGSGYVRHDPRWIELTAPLRNGTDATVRVRFAGLAGYILAKATALRNRSLDKDYYDFAYVLAYNSLGGPIEAAQALRSGPLGHLIPHLSSLWAEVGDRFGADDRVGAKAYATQAKLADPTADIARLRNDAVAVVTAFIDALGW